MAAIAAIVSLVFYATSGITKTADDFFAATQRGDYAAAHALTSKTLQNTASKSGLTSASKDVLPSVEVQQGMVMQDTRRLLAAIQDEDPEVFLERWVDEATVEVLGEGFASLRPGLGSMIALMQAEPEILEAEIDDAGVMTLVGRFEYNRHIADATFKYIERNNSERLVGYNYKIDPKEGAIEDEAIR